MIRAGILGLGTFILIFSLIFVNSGEFTPEIVDQVFETVDTNTLNKLDQNTSTDANLSKFIKYSAKGIAHELHGTYYLASWLSPQLPIWLTENIELLTILAILALCAPILAVALKYFILIAIAANLFAYEKIKLWRKKEAKRK